MNYSFLLETIIQAFEKRPMDDAQFVVLMPRGCYEKFIYDDPQTEVIHSHRSTRVLDRHWDILIKPDVSFQINKIR
jgi:hypothetical protein